MVSRTSFISLL